MPNVAGRWCSLVAVVALWNVAEDASSARPSPLAARARTHVRALPRCCGSRLVGAV